MRQRLGQAAGPLTAAELPKKRAKVFMPDEPGVNFMGRARRGTSLKETKKGHLEGRCLVEARPPPLTLGKVAHGVGWTYHVSSRSLTFSMLQRGCERASFSSKSSSALRTCIVVVVVRSNV